MTAIQAPGGRSKTVQTAEKSARHRVRTSTSQRVIQLVLIVAAALSLAAVFGSILLARVGLVLALLLAVAVLVLARRQLMAVRAEYADRSVRLITLHRSARERAERQHAVAETLREALAQQRDASQQDQETVRSLRVELAEVIGENAELVAELAELRAQGPEAPAADADADSADDPAADPADDTGGTALADVHQLPRRGVSGVAGPPTVAPGWDNLEVDVARS